MNNTQYFRYIEKVRIRFLQELLPELGEPSANTEPGKGLALAGTRCRFKVSLKYPDEITVSAGIREIQERRFVIQHEIYSNQFDCIAAEGDA